MNLYKKCMGKILVTGGAGYIGSHMVFLLMEKGIKKEDIIVLDNLSEGGNRRFLPAEIIFVEGDLLNREKVREVFDRYDIDVVFHFAGNAYVRESMEFPGKYFYNNVCGSINLLEMMKEKNVKKIIFSSSCATYGIPATIPIEENCCQKPINPYGESKLMIEKILKWYNKIYKINYVLLRYFNVGGVSFGLGENHNPETHIIPLIIKLILEDKEIKIFGKDYDTVDGTCVRDFIHVSDLVDAHFRALKFLEEGGSSDSFNLGTNKGNSLLELVKIVEEVSGKKARIVFKEGNAGDPPVLLATFRKAENLLRWKPLRDIHDIIKSAYDGEIRNEKQG